MKKITVYMVSAAMLLLTSCYKDTGYNNNVNNYGSNSNLTFWMMANCTNSNITVTIDGQTSQITAFYPGGQPSCTAYGCASFNLPAGTYAYKATAADTTWQDTVIVPRSGCRMQQLKCAQGNVTFWVDSAANNIKVTLNNTVAFITAAFPTTTPGCGTSGCANFTLPTGTYSYSAITDANVGYVGNVTVTGDSCKLVKVY